MTGGDFIVERLPIWCDSYVIHSGRKLFVDSFSFDMKLMHSIAAGNYWQMVSYPAWRRWRFIAIGNCSVGDFSTSLRSARNDRDGMGAMVIHDGRKLFSKGFLSGMGAM